MSISINWVAAAVCVGWMCAAALAAGPPGGDETSAPEGPTIWSAAHDGDVALLRQLLAAGADPNAAHKTGWTPLQSAAAAGRVEAMRLLLDHGADVNIRGGTTMFIAVERSDLPMAELLMSRGATPHAKTKRDDRETGLLTYAAEMGDIEMIKLLLRHGAGVVRSGHHELDVFDRDGPALDRLPRGRPELRGKELADAAARAARSEKPEVALLLLSAAKSPDLRAVDSVEVERSELARAAAAGDARRVRELLAADDALSMEELAVALHMADQEGRIEAADLIRPVARRRAARSAEKLRLGSELQGTLFEATIRPKESGGHVDRAIHLLRLGADPNVTDERGDQVPLIMAAEIGDERLVRRLIAAGADVNARDPGRDTALSAAVEKGHERIAELLLEHGTDPAAMRQGRAIIGAARRGATEAVRRLLDLGTDPNVRDYFTYTPLIVAAREGHVDTVRLLVERGADVNIVSREGYTALMLAGNEFHDEVVRVLTEAGATGRPNVAISPLYEPIRLNNVDRVKYLLTRGADVNHRTIQLFLDFDSFPLLEAIRERRWAIADLLLETRGRPGGVDLARFPIVALSAKYGDDSAEHIRLMRRLIELGAGVDEPFGDHTALMQAIEENHPNVVRALLEAKAGVDFRCPHDHTALSLATGADQSEVVALLRAAGAER